MNSERPRGELSGMALEKKRRHRDNHTDRHFQFEMSWNSQEVLYMAGR